MTMSVEQKKIYDQIIRDAGNRSIERDAVRRQAHKLSPHVSWDHRRRLFDEMHRGFERRALNITREAAA